VKAKLPSIGEALQWASERLAGGESPKLDARVMLQYVLACDTAYLLTWPERQLSPQQWQQYQTWLNQREQGEPVAYIVGEREFWSLSLSVSPATLIPRPDTEVLVELCLKKANNHADTKIVDLGTGSGAIALALASELPLAQISASELREDALALAQHNAQKLGLEQVCFKQGSWFAPFMGERFDFILSNPPYIDTEDPHLVQGDVRFEPSSALTAEQHGLADIQEIIQQAPDYLKPGGWLMFEHGYDQKQAVQACLLAAGYSEVFTEQDYAGLDRVSGGRYVSNGERD